MMPNEISTASSETEIIAKSSGESSQPAKDLVKSGESHLFSLSIRSIIAMLLVGTFCEQVIAGITVQDGLKDIVMILLGFYYGQGNKPKTQNPS